MKEHVRKDVAWPVNPAEYPLTGPSKGQTYCPPTEYEPWSVTDLAGWATAALIAVALLLVAVFGLASVGYLMRINA